MFWLPRSASPSVSERFSRDGSLWDCSGAPSKLVNTKQSTLISGELVLGIWGLAVAGGQMTLGSRKGQLTLPEWPGEEGRRRAIPGIACVFSLHPWHFSTCPSFFCFAA